MVLPPKLRITPVPPPTGGRASQFPGKLQTPSVVAIHVDVCACTGAAIDIARATIPAAIEVNFIKCTSRSPVCGEARTGTRGCTGLGNRIEFAYGNNVGK